MVWRLPYKISDDIYAVLELSISAFKRPAFHQNPIRSRKVNGAPEISVFRGEIRARLGTKMSELAKTDLEFGASGPENPSKGIRTHQLRLRRPL